MDDLGERRITLVSSGSYTPIIATSLFVYLPLTVALAESLTVAASLVGIALPESLEQFALWIGAVLALVVPALVMWWRQRRGASVTWDDWGVIEWDGEGVRTAIAWSDLSHFIGEYPNSPTDVGLGLQVVDSAGRRITVAVNLSKGGARCRRRARAQNLEGYDALVREVTERSLGKIPGRPWQELDPHRPGRKGWFLPLCAGLGYTAAFFAVIFVEEGSLSFTALGWMLSFAAFAATALAIRALRPLRELLSLHRSAHPRGVTQRVTLLENVGTLITAQDEKGGHLSLETESLEHPDAAVHTRRGAARVVLSLEAKGAASPYRGGGGPATVAYLETEGIAAARRTRTRAVLAELAARVGLVAVMLGFCGAVAYRHSLWSSYQDARTMEDDAQARELFSRACFGGIALACHKAADFAWRGRGGPRDIDAATEALMWGCRLKDSESCARSWFEYADSVDSPDIDHARARVLLGKACEYGHPRACGELATFYLDGLGGPINEAGAVRLFRSSCHQGAEVGCFNLAKCYLDGRGVTENREIAMGLFSRACRDEHGESCYRLASLLQDLPNNEQAHLRARELIEGACRLGHQPACEQSEQ
jgi:hypothetical protein